MEIFFGSIPENLETSSIVVQFGTEVGFRKELHKVWIRPDSVLTRTELRLRIT